MPTRLGHSYGFFERTVGIGGAAHVAIQHPTIGTVAAERWRMPLTRTLHNRTAKLKEQG